MFERKYQSYFKTNLTTTFSITYEKGNSEKENPDTPRGLIIK